MKAKLEVSNEKFDNDYSWIWKLGLSLILFGVILYFVVEYTLAIFMFNACVILLVLINFNYIMKFLKGMGVIKEEPKAKK